MDKKWRILNFRADSIKSIFSKMTSSDDVNVDFFYLNSESESTQAVQLNDMEPKANSKLINKVGFLLS